MNFTGLNSLTYVGGYFYFFENPSLINMTGLEKLSTVEKSLKVRNNNSLIDFTGLNNLTSIMYSLDIKYNDALINMEGLGHLTTIGDNVSIQNNAALSCLAGLEGLTSIGGRLDLVENDRLTSLSGLENIEAGSITGLTIMYNPLLETCNIQSICDYLIDPTGAVDIESNATGCNAAYEVGLLCGIKYCLPGGIQINTQAQVDSFQFNHPDCNWIEGDVWIAGADITNLDGLSHLTSIWGGLYISNNESLTS